MHRSLAPAAALAACLTLTAAAPASAAFSGPPQTFLSGLQTPWEIAPAPDGRTFLTERDTGRIRVVLPGGSLRDAPAYDHDNQVLGLALHPRFTENRLAYVHQRYTEAGDLRTRVIRLRDDGTSLVPDGKVVIAGIDSGDNHDGGRIAFGPDGRLYVTTGDQHDPRLPTDHQSLNGKILRLAAPGDATDGDAPADNPFFAEGGNARFVWSLGHRHPQGLAWDAQGRLWSSEHGPSGEGHAPDGAKCCRDELNLIVKGGDYGWPRVAGDQRLEGTIAPVVHSGETTWAPGGLAFGDDGSLYAPALVGQHLHVFEPAGETIARHFELYRGEFGRLRTAVATGGALLFSEDKPTGARILRAPFGPAAPPPPPAPPAPPPPPAAAPPAPTTAQALDRLLARTRTVLTRRGLASLLRRRAVAARAGGLPPGRVIVRATLIRPGRRALTVGIGTARVRDRRAVAVRLRVTPTGRRTLRRVRRARIDLRARHVAPGGARAARTVRVTVRR